MPGGTRLAMSIPEVKETLKPIATSCSLVTSPLSAALEADQVVSLMVLLQGGQSLILERRMRKMLKVSGNS